MRSKPLWESLVIIYYYCVSIKPFLSNDARRLLSTTFERRLNITGESVVRFGSFERTVRMNQFTKTNWTSQICSLSLSHSFSVCLALYHWRKTSWRNRVCLYAMQGLCKCDAQVVRSLCGFAAYVLLNDRAKSASCDVQITYPPTPISRATDRLKWGVMDRTTIYYRSWPLLQCFSNDTNILYQYRLLHKSIW